MSFYKSRIIPIVCSVCDKWDQASSILRQTRSNADIVGDGRGKVNVRDDPVFLVATAQARVSDKQRKSDAFLIHTFFSNMSVSPPRETMVTHENDHGVIE